METVSNNKLFFIYVAKNEEWKRLEEEDWNYVSSMVKFFYWWTKKYFHLKFDIDADILPVITGKLFDRMSLGYLLRDHQGRGQSTYHFYLSYFKPFWGACHNIGGYATSNFGMLHWIRPNSAYSDEQRSKFFADNNCARVSHILLHEILRIIGKKQKDYFDKVHDLWDEHEYKGLPFLYYNEHFSNVTKDSYYRFVTMDISKLRY
ncbi:MAG: hypothetical protein R3321_10780 [Nitrososphaeraceae archaeon]|nr:hypothetical protein [Nitrososphaeraceae archaeon]